MPSRGIDGRAHLKTILIFFRRRTLYIDIYRYSKYSNFNAKNIWIFPLLNEIFIAKQIISES